MSLSTHVLDAAKGRPAAGVAVRLERRDDGDWSELDQGTTDTDGRISGWRLTAAGAHRLTFDTGGYLGPGAFYPEASVTFTVTDPDEHHHIPLLLSPFAYSTYRGS